MTSIENSIRRAILTANAINSEQRNKVYLAARDTIYRLQPNNNQKAIEQLAEAVRKIEHEYAVRELATSHSLPADSDYAPAEFPNMDPLPDGQSYRTFPWLTIIATILLIAFLVGSTFLLWTQFEKITGPDSTTEYIKPELLKTSLVSSFGLELKEFP